MASGVICVGLAKETSITKSNEPVDPTGPVHPNEKLVVSKGHVDIAGFCSMRGAHGRSIRSAVEPIHFRGVGDL